MLSIILHLSRVLIGRDTNDFRHYAQKNKTKDAYFFIILKLYCKIAILSAKNS